jgi:hypothetical protein
MNQEGGEPNMLRPVAALARCVQMSEWQQVSNTLTGEYPTPLRLQKECYHTCTGAPAALSTTGKNS